MVYTLAFVTTAADLMTRRLLSEEKHAQLLAYMYGPFSVAHAELLAQADLKPHLWRDIGIWGQHEVAAGEMATHTSVHCLALYPPPWWGRRQRPLQGRKALCCPLGCSAYWQHGRTLRVGSLAALAVVEATAVATGIVLEKHCQ